MVVDFAFPLLLLLVGGVVGALYLREKRRKEAWQLQGADQADDLRVPHFFARRQIALFDWLGRTFGGQDIDFPQDEAFSTAFVLQGEDEAATRELFAPSLRQALLRQTARASSSKAGATRSCCTGAGSWSPRPCGRTWTR